MMIRAELEARDFHGFRLVGRWPSWIEQVPTAPGVYVVLRTEKTPPSFLRRSRGGRFRGRDPTVSTRRLKARWVDSTDLLYVGKADELKERITALCEFAKGRRVGHWGGRFLWQVRGHEAFLVAWLPSAGRDPFDVERCTLLEFKDRYGRWPFANIQGPRRARQRRRRSPNGLRLSP